MATKKAPAKPEPKDESKPAEPKADEKPAKAVPPQREPPTREEQVKAWTAPQPHSLDDLLEKGDLVARYLEQHGTWETQVHLTHLGRREVRVLRYCECPICTDARAELGLTD